MDNEKRKVPVAKRVLCIAAGCMLFAGAAAAGIYFLPPQTSTAEQTEYTYRTFADVSYRVKLVPNQLYSENWLEEGRLYSSILTDQIEVTFTGDFTGSLSAAVSGNYTVTGIVEGYQETKDSRMVIYERKFPLTGGEAFADDTGGAVMKEVVSLNMEQYRKTADEADLILGGTPSRRFYLLLEGSFSSETPYGNVQEPFSLFLNIPIQKPDGFYEIPKPEPFVKTGQLTSEKEVTVPAGPAKIVSIGAWAVLSLAFTVWALFFTRNFNEEEIYCRQCNALLRKYGSRMVELKQLDKNKTERAMEVSDMDHLILIAEEIRRPVCYGLNEKGFPESGILYVPDGENGYVLRLKEPSTTLEVYEEEESSKESD